MTGLDLTKLCSDITTYSSYSNCPGPLTYKMLNNAILTLQNQKMEWSYYDDELDCWRYCISNWNYGKSLPEKTMENNNVGARVKIIRDNSGRNLGVGFSGTILSVHYQTREYLVRLDNGEELYCTPDEIEPLFTQIIYPEQKSIYTNQIAEDLAKIK